MRWQWDVCSTARGPEVESVRGEIREALVACGADDVAGAELLVWELLTNALFHAGTGAKVCLCGDGRTVRAEVTDGGEDDLELRPMDPNRVGGHGLELVDALSGSWGVTDEPHGKTVWFEMGATGAGVGT